MQKASTQRDQVCVDALQPAGARPNDHRQKQCTPKSVWGKSESKILLMRAKDKTTESKKQHYGQGTPRSLHLLGLTGLWGSILSQLQPRVPSGTRHACSWATSQPRSQTPRAARGGSYTLHQEQPLAPSDTHSRARCTVRRILLFYRYFSSALNAVMLPLRSPPEHSCCSHRLKLRYDRILTIHCTI